MVNFFENFRKNFSAPSERGARTAAGGFALTGRLLSLHRLNGVRELPQAGSPLTGGKFFAEPQRGIRRLRTAGTCRAPRRGRTTQRKGQPAVSLPLWTPTFPLLPISWAQIAYTVYRSGKGRTADGFPLPCLSYTCSQFTDSVPLHIQATLRRARHNRAAQIRERVIIDTAPARINCTERLIRRCRPV